MPESRGFVSTVVRIDPPLVEFDDGEQIRLDPDDRRTPGFAEILEELSKQHRPVYIEAGPSGSIERLLIPYVTRVAGLEESDRGLEIQLEDSHARHLLPPGREDLAGTLREAFETKTPMVFVVGFEQELVDIRAYKPHPDGPFPPLGDWPPLRRIWWPWWRRWWWWSWLWPWWPWWWFRCVSETKAQEVFDAMSATTCAPLTVPPPCIPFMFPDDGCWGRAHEMRRLMVGMGLNPNKVWISGKLHTLTRNNPKCFVEWGWHVAPTLCVRVHWWWRRTMVIDPSLFTTPVSKADWKAVQGNPGATLTDTPGSDFLWGATDDTYTQTNQVLATYRLKLKNRSLQVGPPPYANCP